MLFLYSVMPMHEVCDTGHDLYGMIGRCCLEKIELLGPLQKTHMMHMPVMLGELNPINKMSGQNPLLMLVIIQQPTEHSAEAGDHSG